MSRDKFLGRGFGGSGASNATWSPPRDSYKAPVDTGSSFLMGGGGLRGKPAAASKESSSTFDTQAFDAGASKLDRTPRLRDRSAILQNMSDVRGGDTTASFLQRWGTLGFVLAVSLIFSFFVRACASDSGDADWIKERRSAVEQSDYEQ